MLRILTALFVFGFGVMSSAQSLVNPLSFVGRYKTVSCEVNGEAKGKLYGELEIRRYKTNLELNSEELGDHGASRVRIKMTALLGESPDKGPLHTGTQIASVSSNSLTNTYNVKARRGLKWATLGLVKKARGAVQLSFPDLLNQNLVSLSIDDLDSETGDLKNTETCLLERK